jgi:hypothetical protein
MTIAHPAAGQPGVTNRVGTSTSAAPSSTAAASALSRRRRSSTAAPTVRAASSSPPDSPPGQGSAASSMPAPQCATPTSQATRGPATRRHSRARPAHTGDTAAASTPSTVTGPTAGAASTFATTAIRLT